MRAIRRQVAPLLQVKSSESGELDPLRTHADYAVHSKAADRRMPALEPRKPDPFASLSSPKELPEGIVEIAKRLVRGALVGEASRPAVLREKNRLRNGRI